MLSLLPPSPSDPLRGPLLPPRHRLPACLPGWLAAVQGFIPRASELLKLGLTFFLAFVPFILVISLAFSGIYAVFGDSFVHGGTPASGPPPYIDPDMLLAEPTADPMVPLDLR